MKGDIHSRRDTFKERYIQGGIHERRVHARRDTCKEGIHEKRICTNERKKGR